MAEMLRKEIQDLLMNQDFTKGLLELEDESKVKEYFLEHGNVELTDDEVKQVKQSVKGVMDKVATLPEAELDKVAGGVWNNGIWETDDYNAEFAPVDIESSSYEIQCCKVDNELIRLECKFSPDLEAETATRNPTPSPSGSNKIPTWGKVAIGSAAVAAVAGIGAGVYALGRKKGWWSK